MTLKEIVKALGQVYYAVGDRFLRIHRHGGGKNAPNDENGGKKTKTPQNHCARNEVFSSKRKDCR